MTGCSSWEAWAPPLDPPTPGGLPYAEAECIAAAWWDDDQHAAAALMWEAYAATLPPAPAVRAVSTGAQSVTYDGGADPFGLAMGRAAWHWSRASNLGSVPLRVAPVEEGVPALPLDWWQRNLLEAP